MKKVTKKAGFFDPYLDSLGGGERYTLTLAEFLAGRSFQVDVFWDSPEIKKDLISRFNLNLERVNFIPTQKNLLNRAKISSSYNLFFWLSDGSVPFLFSKNNLLHFQVPFRSVNGRSLLNRLKLTKINHVVCNSGFTKKFIDKEFGVNSMVIPPPVDIKNFSPGKKENLILSVGRFSQLLQAKRQDVLVSAFKKLCDQGLPGWQLILAGATGVGGREFFEKLKVEAAGYPIKLLADIDFESLKSLYGKAKIFWFASGFDVDEDKNPEKVEHFGMTVVEAMAAGCVPIVVPKGGVKEIVKQGETGFFWQDENKLLGATRDLISHPQTLKKLSPVVVKSSQKFSKEKFCREFDEIITSTS